MGVVLGAQVPRVRSWYRFGAAQIASITLFILSGLFLWLADPWSGSPTTWRSDLFLGLFGNLTTGAVTALIVDVIGQRQAKQEQLRRLILDMLSRDPSITKRAVKELQDEGWLTDGTLNKIDLSYVKFDGADLTKVDLTGSILRGAEFIRCGMRGAVMNECVLEGASIRRCDLSGASMKNTKCRLSDWSESDLRSANFYQADLSESKFAGADLSGCRLNGADIRGADLSGATGVKDSLSKVDER